MREVKHIIFLPLLFIVGACIGGGLWSALTLMAHTIAAGGGASASALSALRVASGVMMLLVVPASGGIAVWLAVRPEKPLEGGVNVQIGSGKPLVVAKDQHL